MTHGGLVCAQAVELVERLHLSHALLVQLLAVWRLNSVGIVAAVVAIIVVVVDAIVVVVDASGNW